MRGEGKAALEHIAHALVVRLGARDDDAVGRARLHHVAHRLQRIVGARIGRDDQVIGRLRQMLGDAVDHVRDEAADLLLGVEHEADDVGLAGPEPHAGAVRPVADLPRDELHAAARLLADLGRVLQRTRDGGDAEPGHEGNRLQGRTPRRLGEGIRAWNVRLVHELRPTYCPRRTQRQPHSDFGPETRLPQAVTLQLLPLDDVSVSFGEQPGTGFEARIPGSRFRNANPVKSGC